MLGGVAGARKLSGPYADFGARSEPSRKPVARRSSLHLLSSGSKPPATDALTARSSTSFVRSKRCRTSRTWARAHLLVALAHLVAHRRLEAGVGLVLDRMCFGDPGETMRDLRHSLEATV